MFEGISVLWHEVCETFAAEGLNGIVRRRVYWRRDATPTVMDLASIPAHPADWLQGTGFRLVEVKLEDLDTQKWIFTVPSRGFKARRNIKRGWRGFAIVQENRVIGDVWCVAPRGDEIPLSHPDLGMLGITCRNKDAYAFDMLISPTYRGKNLAGLFQRSLHASLKAEGLEKVYGYYWDDNVPALWMHRILKFRELPKRQVSRFLFIMRAETIRDARYIVVSHAPRGDRDS